ncbi:MAG: hypothetical protein DRI65_16090 [Chloroflexota bacterium]|nr:MAG: hypothetical protein DRI65_16090 [Chloroflexota bacterium]
MNTANSIYFPTSYQESRIYFRAQMEKVKKVWPSATLDKYLISDGEDLTIDWITAQPIRQNKKLILITTGLHGVEGFVGAAMLDLFIKEYISLLDPQVTGIQLVHGINPWGMANTRRVNKNNVDLNRNFMERQEVFLDEFNPEYKNLDGTLNPVHPLKALWIEEIGFLKNVIVNLSRYGVRSMRGAVMLGQQSNPAGLYFSGREFQPETIFLKKLIIQGLSSYGSVLHIDMHTGYGPSSQMTIVNSPAEPMKSDQLINDFQYPRILQADPEQFYRMQGDLVDWVYRLKEVDYPKVNHFGMAFEFGTYGEGILKEIKSLRTMIYENQTAQHGSSSAKLDAYMRKEFLEMYFPYSSRWREKAILDCRQAFSGVLSAEGYIYRALK